MITLLTDSYTPSNFHTQQFSEEVNNIKAKFPTDLTIPLLQLFMAKHCDIHSFNNQSYSNCNIVLISSNNVSCQLYKDKSTKGRIQYSTWLKRRLYQLPETAQLFLRSNWSFCSTYGKFYIPFGPQYLNSFEFFYVRVWKMKITLTGINTSAKFICFGSFLLLPTYKSKN